MAISYDKLRKIIQQNYGRLRALVERVFPELLKVLNLDTKTARYLLGRYLLPEEFLRLDLEAETKALEKVSRSQHGQETLLRIQALARRTIGLACPPSVARAERLALESWLTLIEALEAQIAQVTDELIQLARKTPYFAPLVSLKRYALAWESYAGRALKNVKKTASAAEKCMLFFFLLLTSSK